MSSPLTRKNLGPRLAMAAVTFALMVAVADAVRSRWIIGGVGPNDPSSLVGHWFFIVDRHDRVIGRGTLVAFKTDVRMRPWFQPGTLFIKQVVAVPGDTVEVSEAGLQVNGRRVADALPLATTLKTSAQALSRRVAVLQGQVWVVGTSPDSFDSRYWGPVWDAQIVGVASVVL